MFQEWLGNQLKKPTGFVSKWVGKYMENENYEINDWTLSLVNIKGKESILEVGVGNGSTLNRVAQLNINGENYGVDVSKEMVKEAIKLNKYFIENEFMDIRESDIGDMPFSNDHFDKIYTVHTIYFWGDLDKGLSETYRMLKPNGTLFISIMDTSYMKKMKRTKNFNLLENQEIENGLRMQKFKEIIIHNKGMFCCIEARK